MSKLKSIFKFVAFNVLLLFAGLVILELIFGNWLGNERSNRLGVARDLERTYSASHLYDGASNVVYKRDKYGLRGTYDSPSEIDILTLGGSTTDQRYLTEGATWQDVLAKEFAAGGECGTISVVNAGVDGQSTIGHIKNFDWWFPTIPHLKVRYYLLYVGVNDFFILEDLSNANTLDRYGRVFDAIENNSALYNLLRILNGVQRAADAGVGHRKIDFEDVEWITTPTVEDYQALMSGRLSNYAKRLRTLGTRIKEAGAVPICATQPLRVWKIEDGRVKGMPGPIWFDDETDINGIDYYYMMGLLNETTVTVCTEIGGIAVDLANGVDWDDGDFYDSVHNTPQGAAKIGRYLFSELNGPVCE